MNEHEISKERLAIMQENSDLWDRAVKKQQETQAEYPEVYNNFHCNVAGISKYGFVDYRDYAAKQGFLNKPMVDNHSQNNSEKAQETTMEEFFSDFDRSVELSGVAPELQEILQELERNPKDRGVYIWRLQDALKPVYVELRLMGYNYQDITQ